jgi:hypothetical protein
VGAQSRIKRIEQLSDVSPVFAEVTAPMRERDSTSRRVLLACANGDVKSSMKNKDRDFTRHDHSAELIARILLGWTRHARP